MRRKSPNALSGCMGSMSKGRAFKATLILRTLFALGLSFVIVELVLQGPKLSLFSGIRGATTKELPQQPQHSNTCLSLQVGEGKQVNPVERFIPHPSSPENCLFYTKPTPYIDLLMKALVGFPNQGSLLNGQKPYSPMHRLYGMDWPPYGYTMVGTTRLENFRAAIEEVNRNRIPGAIMELGVWRGGAMIMATAVSNEYKSLGGTMDREMYVLDAFEDIPPDYGNAKDFLFNTQQNVMDNFKLYNVYEGESKVNFVKGLFKDSVPTMASDSNTGQIAVLRVDGNFYDSYQDALYYLYGKVPVGGIVIFDDVMTHEPVTRCWNDFKADQGLPEELNRIDLHSAWFRKEKDVAIDMSKMRAPQDVNKQ